MPTRHRLSTELITSITHRISGQKKSVNIPQLPGQKMPEHLKSHLYSRLVSEKRSKICPEGRRVKGRIWYGYFPVNFGFSVVSVCRGLQIFLCNVRLIRYIIVFYLCCTLDRWVIADKKKKHLEKLCTDIVTLFICSCRGVNRIKKKI